MKELNSIMNFSLSDLPSFSIKENHNFQLGVGNFYYSDLYKSERLKELVDIFYQQVKEDAPELWQIWEPYLASAGENHTLTPKAESDIIVRKTFSC